MGCVTCEKASKGAKMSWIGQVTTKYPVTTSRTSTSVLQPNRCTGQWNGLEMGCVTCEKASNVAKMSRIGQVLTKYPVTTSRTSTSVLQPNRCTGQWNRLEMGCVTCEKERKSVVKGRRVDLGGHRII